MSDQADVKIAFNNSRNSGETVAISIVESDVMQEAYENRRELCVSADDNFVC